MVPSVRMPRVYEHIVDEIEGAIYDGRLQRGDKLPPERQLVRQFHASRVAVREALRTLEHRGLLDVRQGAAGGHFIRDVDSRLLRRDFHRLLRLGRVTVGQLTEARVLIEPEIARLAALRATDADLKLLGGAIAERRELTEAGRHPRALGIDFHRLVAEAAKNPVHAVVIHAVMDVEADVVTAGIELSDVDNAAVDRAHQEIFDAIAAREPSRARAAMERHVVDVQRRLSSARGEMI